MLGSREQSRSRTAEERRARHSSIATTRATRLVLDAPPGRDASDANAVRRSGAACHWRTQMRCSDTKARCPPVQRRTERTRIVDGRILGRRTSPANKSEGLFIHVKFAALPGNAPRRTERGRRGATRLSMSVSA